MSVWKSRGLRGSAFEELINRTNEKYRENNLCIVQKIPTPITPISMDKSHKQITLAYFDMKSTVDYIGAVQGIPVCFDAKECAVDTFTLANIHEHQVNFMRDFEGQGGIAFFLIYYTKRDEIYYLRFEKLMEFWDRMLLGGRKSFKHDEIEPEFILNSSHAGVFVPYLDAVQLDLTKRD